MLVHRRNLLESVRPELVLVGWTRGTRGTGEEEHQVLGFRTIRNVGRGAALNVHFQLLQETASRPTAMLSTTRLPIIAPNESIDVNSEIILWWKNVPAECEHRHLSIEIPIGHMDSRNMRHETLYTLFVVEPPTL